MRFLMENWGSVLFLGAVSALAIATAVASIRRQTRGEKPNGEWWG